MKKHLKAAKQWSRDKYLVLFEFLTLKALLLVGKMMRKLVILKGKDPDRIPVKKQLAKMFDSGHEARFSNLYKKDWVQNPRKHPVLFWRAKNEAKVNTGTDALNVVKDTGNTETNKD